eukprot:scaffold447_cov307-Pinguiococcus_pyrenoidosus.AAC.84
MPPAGDGASLRAEGVALHDADGSNPELPLGRDHDGPDGRRSRAARGGELPSQLLEGGDLQRIPDEIPLDAGQTLAGRKSDGRKGRYLGKLGDVLSVGFLFAIVPQGGCFGSDGAQPGDTDASHAVGGERACLVEGTHVDSARQRDAERLCAVDVGLHELLERVGDGQAELYRQLWRDHRRHDHDAVEHELVLVPALVLPARLQDEGGGAQGHSHEEADEHDRLGRGVADPLRSKHQRQREVALGRAEAALQHQRRAASVRRGWNGRGALLGHRLERLRNVGSRIRLQNVRPAQEHVSLQRALRWLRKVQDLLRLQVRQRLLQLRHALARQHGLVDDAASIQQQHVGRDGDFALLPLRDARAHRDDPARGAVDVHDGGRLPHLPQGGQRLDAVQRHGGLEDHQHDQREERVDPVVIQRPQQHAQDLEQEERRGGLLEEQLQELRLGDVAHVPTPPRLGLAPLSRVGVASPAAHVRHRGGARILQALENAAIVLNGISRGLELQRGLIQRELRAKDHHAGAASGRFQDHNRAAPVVLSRDHEDVRGGVETRHLDEAHLGAEAHAPFGAQHCEDVNHESDAKDAKRLQLPPRSTKAFRKQCQRITRPQASC